MVINILVGTVLGFLAGIGVGGGSLLMLWLTTFQGLDHPEARVINLLFFLPSALISSFFHRKAGTLQLKSAMPGILAGCLSAAALSLLSQHLDTGLLKKLFGGLLVITGLREIFYRPKNAK